MKKITLGNYIVRLRIKKKINIRQLERLSGVSFSAIQRIEDGTTVSPGIGSLLALSKALNVPIMSLILAYEGHDPDEKSLEAFQEKEVQGVLRSLGKDILEKLVERIPEKDIIRLVLELSNHSIKDLEPELRK